MPPSMRNRSCETRAVYSRQNNCTKSACSDARSQVKRWTSPIRMKLSYFVEKPWFLKNKAALSWGCWLTHGMSPFQEQLIEFSECAGSDAPSWKNKYAHVKEGRHTRCGNFFGGAGNELISTAVSVFAYVEYIETISYNAFVIISTITINGNVLLSFSLLWSHVCLYDRQHICCDTLQTNEKHLCETLYKFESFIKSKKARMYVRIGLLTTKTPSQRTNFDIHF